jgi:hypothetical protein
LTAAAAAAATTAAAEKMSVSIHNKGSEHTRRCTYASHPLNCHYSIAAWLLAHCIMFHVLKQLGHMLLGVYGG